MTLQHVDKLFQLIVFLFAISFHESAHAWTANRCGDPTARMLGWAKPTPVNPQNFRNPVRDDILTSVAGPISNFLVAGGALCVLALISFVSPLGHQIIHAIPFVYPNRLELLAAQTGSALMPLSLLAYELMVINIVLGVFNLIPVPPLDGSHVLRHFLSDSLLRIYDTVGIFGLMALVYLGSGLL